MAIPSSDWLLIGPSAEFMSLRTTIRWVEDLWKVYVLTFWFSQQHQWTLCNGTPCLQSLNSSPCLEPDAIAPQEFMCSFVCTLSDFQCKGLVALSPSPSCIHWRTSRGSMDSEQTFTRRVPVLGAPSMAAHTEQGSSFRFIPYPPTPAPPNSSQFYQPNNSDENREPLPSVPRHGETISSPLSPSHCNLFNACHQLSPSPLPSSTFNMSSTQVAHDLNMAVLDMKINKYQLSDKHEDIHNFTNVRPFFWMPDQILTCFIQLSIQEQMTQLYMNTQLQSKEILALRTELVETRSHVDELKIYVRLGWVPSDKLQVSLLNTSDLILRVITIAVV